MLNLFLLVITFSAILSWIISNLKNKSFSLKFSLTTILLYISLCLFYSYNDSMGWPTYERLPAKFFLKSFIIDEPSDKSKGNIYIWLVKEQPDKCPTGLLCIKRSNPNEPRAHRVDYSENIHEGMIDAEESLKKGENVIIEIIKKDTNEEDIVVHKMPTFMDIYVK